MSYGVPSTGIVMSPDAGPVPPVPLQQPMNLFRFGEQTIWSTLQLAAVAPASSTNRLFTTPIGQQGQGLTAAASIAETNLKEGGRVPSGVAYDVFGVSCHIQSGAAGNVPLDTQALIGDLINVQNNGVLSWDFTQTVVDIAPVLLCGAGGGAFGAVSQNAAGANSGHMNNGNGAIWMYRKHPVALPGNSTFSIVLRFGSQAPALSQITKIKVTLLGYYKNVIEIG